MGNGKEQLPPLIPWDREGLDRWVKEKERREKEEAAARGPVVHYADIMRKKLLETFDTTKPAYQLDKELPRDLKALTDIAYNATESMERREKALEVIILRGADKLSYDDMVWASTPPHGIPGFYQEKLAYQQAAQDLVMRQDPALFKKLSQSTDPLPDNVGGRYPATEWMNMMVREGGPLGKDEKRAEVFTPWVVGLPAEERGRAVFHLGDAAGSGERNKGMTLAPYVEVQKAPLTFGVNYQAGPDSHWNMAVDGTLGKVEHSLGYNNEKGPDPEKAQDRQAFYHGYVLASRGLATPSNPGPDEK